MHIRLILAVEGAGGLAQKVAIGPDGLRIGRDGSAGLQLPSPEVSSRHCHIEAWGGGYRLIDTSLNGTVVNGERVERDLPYAIRPGDRIDIAEYRLSVETEASSSMPPEAPRADDTAAPVQTSRARKPSRFDDKRNEDIGAIAAPAPNGAAISDPLTAALLDALLALLAARRKERSEAGVPAAMTGQAMTLAEARTSIEAQAILARSADGAKLVEAAVALLLDHERAKLAALQYAFRAVLGQIAPAAVRSSAGTDASACWREYEHRFGSGGEGGLADQLATAFADGLRKAHPVD